jgi:hypothetical protein
MRHVRENISTLHWQKFFAGHKHWVTDQILSLGMSSLDQMIACFRFMSELISPEKHGEFLSAQRIPGKM